MWSTGRAKGYASCASIAVVVALLGRGWKRRSPPGYGRQNSRAVGPPGPARIREASKRAETYHRSVRLQRYQVNLSQEPKIKLGAGGATGNLKVVHLDMKNKRQQPGVLRRLPRRLSWPGTPVQPMLPAPRAPARQTTSDQDAAAAGEAFRPPGSAEGLGRTRPAGLAGEALRPLLPPRLTRQPALELTGKLSRDRFTWRWTRACTTVRHARHPACRKSR